MCSSVRPVFFLINQMPFQGFADAHVIASEEHPFPEVIDESPQVEGHEAARTSKFGTRKLLLSNVWTRRHK